jgi:hypothetical protein
MKIDVNIAKIGVFNWGGGYLSTSQSFFPPYLKIKSYFDMFFSTMFSFVIV